MNPRTAARFTVVSFHAHPDDEALLTSGTLARAAAAGHRVVLVVATNGEAGLSADSTSGDLGAVRQRELQASARAIGAARVETLGYADSGSAGPTGPWRDDVGSWVPFSGLDPERIAPELARILLEEKADVLTTYDAAGGYGHPDHIQVHRVGSIAARLAGTPVVLEATLDRGVIIRLVRVLRLLSRFLPMPRLPDMSDAFTDGGDITHRVDVRAQLPAKRASLRAHTSQTGGGPRTLRLLLALPGWAQRLALGSELYREVGRVPGTGTCDDIFDSLRGREGQATYRRVPRARWSVRALRHTASTVRRSRSGGEASRRS